MDCAGQRLGFQVRPPANSGKAAAPTSHTLRCCFVRDSQPGKPVQRRVLDGAGDIDESTMAVVRGQLQHPVVQGWRGGHAVPAFACGPIPRLAGTLPRQGLPVLPHTEVYHGIGGDFAPFAMMRLTDPLRIDAVISDAEEPRYTSTLDVQYVQTFDDTIQRFVGADIILADGFSPDVTIRVEAP